MATTTIQISTDLKEVLSKRKLYDKETYEDILWDLLEDTLELSEQTKRHIKEAEEDYKAGRVYTLEQVKRKYKL